MQHQTEKDFALYLRDKGLLPGPEQCKYNCKIFSIQKDISSKTSQCVFRCANSKCRRKFRIRIKSLYVLFPYITLRLISEIINCFICRNLNAQDAVKYISSEKNITVSSHLVTKVYDSLIDVISKYLFVVYETEILGEENKGGYFSVDESMFGNANGNQFWLLGIVDNSNHDDFRIDFAETRDTDSIKAFISKHVKKGNNIY
jgi:hypothetical protein